METDVSFVPNSLTSFLAEIKSDENVSLEFGNIKRTREVKTKFLKSNQIQLSMETERGQRNLFILEKFIFLGGRGGRRLENFQKIILLFGTREQHLKCTKPLRGKCLQAIKDEELLN